MILPSKWLRPLSDAPKYFVATAQRWTNLRPFGSLLTVPTTLRVFKPCVVEKAKAEPFPAQHVSIIVGKGQLTSFICASLSSLFAYVILCSSPCIWRFGKFLKLELTMIPAGSQDKHPEKLSDTAPYKPSRQLYIVLYKRTWFLNKWCGWHICWPLSTLILFIRLYLLLTTCQTMFFPRGWWRPLSI